MSYTDVVLSKNPVQYSTISDASGSVSKDLTGNGQNIPGYMPAPNYLNNSVGYQNGVGMLDTIECPNKVGVLTPDSTNLKYSIECWVKPKVSIFSGEKNSTFDIIASDNGLDPSSYKIYIENSFIKFLITDYSGNKYICSVKINNWDSNFHVVAEYWPGGIQLFVNSIASEIIKLPKNLNLHEVTSNYLKLNSTNLVISHLAIYSRLLTQEEVNSNFSAGKNYLDKAGLTTNFSGKFYSLSNQTSQCIFRKRIGQQDFIVGDIKNLIIDNGYLKCIEYDSFSVRNSSLNDIDAQYDQNSISGLSLYNSSTPEYYHGYLPALGPLGNTYGFVVINFDINAIDAVKVQEIFTINIKSDRKYYRWYIDTDSKINLEVASYTTDGTETIKEYHYETEVSHTGSNNILMAIVFNSSGIKVSKILPALNQVPESEVLDFLDDDSNYIYQNIDNTLINKCKLVTDSSYSEICPEQINIDEKTELLFNCGPDYLTDTASKNPAKNLRKLWLGNKIPTEFVSDEFEYLIINENNSAHYDFTVSNLNDNRVEAHTEGRFTYTFHPAISGEYYGTYMDFDLTNDGLSYLQIRPYGETWQIAKEKNLIPVLNSSNNASYTDFILEEDFPAITVQAVLKTISIEENRPSISYIDFYVYKDKYLNASSGVGVAEISSGTGVTGTTPFPNVIVKPFGETPWESGKQLNCSFLSPGYIKFPAYSGTGGTGSYKNIELTFSYEGTISQINGNNPVLLEQGSNSVSLTTAGGISVTGPNWSSSTVYLNGVTASSNPTVQSDSINYLLIYSNTITSNNLYLNSDAAQTKSISYYNNDSSYCATSYGYLAYWEDDLTDDQKNSLPLSRFGLLSGPSNITTTDSISIVETATPKILSVSWPDASSI